MIQKLSRKRVCPFERSKLEIWAAAVIYTIGNINFLFDKSFEPYIKSEEIHNFFGTKSSTVGADSLPEEFQEIIKEARNRGENISFTTK